MQFLSSELPSIQNRGLIHTESHPDRPARENIPARQPALAESKAAPDAYGARPPILAGNDAGFAPLPALAPTPIPASMPAQPQLPATVVDARPARTDAPARPSLVMLKPAPVKAVAAGPAAIAPRKSTPVVAVKPAPVRALVANASRPKKSSSAPERAPAAALDPAVESDVALLSAIIIHSSRHAGERAQLEAARCGGGKKCALAPAPLTSLKATD
ncbi:hypothetical protein [Massilia psychrophila]|nr:hypothetical protein [Massilia psychrophila]